jgi:hypothetical protein
MSTDLVNEEGLSTDSTQMKDNKAHPKRRFPCCFWITLFLASSLFIMGVTTLSILWPHEMEPYVQSATCSVSPEYLKQTAVNLRCDKELLSFVNQTEQKSCKEAELAMVLECQQGLQGFDDKCPFPLGNATSCATPEGQGYSLYKLICSNGISLKANVTLKDGRKLEQLELVLPRIGSDKKLNFTSLETFDCYYTKVKPKEIYSDEESAENFDGLAYLGWYLGLLLGWIPFAISIVLLLALGIYYRTGKIE